MRKNRFTLRHKIIISVTALTLGFVSWAVFIKTAPSSYGTTNWIIVSTDIFNVRIPDGWTVSRTNNSVVDGDCVPCLKYVEGKKAVILTGGPASITREQSNPFLITPQTLDETEAHFFEGFDKVGTISAKNATGNKYYKQITPSEEFGFQSESKLYGYALARGSNVVFVRYAALPGKVDQHEIIETLIHTLELK